MRQRFVFFSLESIKCGMLSNNTAQLKSRPYSFFFVHSRMILMIQATKKTIIPADIQYYTSAGFLCLALLHIAFCVRKILVRTAATCLSGKSNNRSRYSCYEKIRVNIQNRQKSTIDLKNIGAKQRILLQQNPT